MSTIQIAANAVKAKLVNADRSAKLIVSELLSYEVAGHEHMNAFKKGGWDGRSTFFDFRQATFPAGFIHMVAAKLRREGHEIQFLRKRPPAPLGPVMPKVDEFDPDPRYDYQEETMRRLLKYGQMVAQVATGGGKSRIAKFCTARIRRPTLFLTTRGVLMYQMKEAYEDAGFAVGVLGDGEWSPRRGVNVGMVQTLAQRLEELTEEGEVERYFDNLKAKEDRQVEDYGKQLKKKKLLPGAILKEQKKFRLQLMAQRKKDEVICKEIQEKVKRHNMRRLKTIKILQLFELVIGEEAHESGGNSYYEVLKHCKNAHYRLALTATPFMRDNQEDNMRLMACFGPVAIKISEKELIDRGILAKPYFKYIDTQKPSRSFRRSAGWQTAYAQGIVKNDFRNEAIAYEAVRGANLGLPVMILVQRKEHGRLLKQLIERAGIKAKFIFGESSQDQRKKTLQQLKGGEFQVLIGSTILDVGVDVPAVGMVILAGGGKAEVALRQRIGRGLRAKKNMPNVCFVIDFNDNINTYLHEHAANRRSIVANTPGFGENILPVGADFDFEGLGITALAA
jgi:superfamily II DNA or RNA helicase